MEHVTAIVTSQKLENHQTKKGTTSIRQSFASGLVRSGKALKGREQAVPLCMLVRPRTPVAWDWCFSIFFPRFQNHVGSPWSPATTYSHCSVKQVRQHISYRITGHQLPHRWPSVTASL